MKKLLIIAGGLLAALTACNGCKSPAEPEYAGYIFAHMTCSTSPPSETKTKACISVPRRYSTTRRTHATWTHGTHKTLPSVRAIKSYNNAK